MPYQTITLGTLQTLVYARVENSPFWSLNEVNWAINEGVKLYGLSTGRFKQRFVINTVAKRCIYTVATGNSPNLPNVLAILRVAYNGTPLAWSSVDDIDAAFPGWQAQTTASAGVPNAPLMAGTFGGLNYFFIWPCDPTGGNSLQLDTIVSAPVLVNSGDFLNLDQSEAVAIIGFAVWRLCFKRGGIYLEESKPLLKQFLAMCAQRNGNLRALSIFRESIGDDRSRRTKPRRISDRTGVPYGIGVR